jgi:hypothetical protein
MNQIDLAVVAEAIVEEKSRYPSSAMLLGNRADHESSSENDSQPSAAISDKEPSQTDSIAVVTLLDLVRPPTSEELATLRRIGGKIPVGAWLVALIGFAERFAYYGVTAPFRQSQDSLFASITTNLCAENYIQNHRDDPLRPGALGLGQASATRLSYFLTFFVYATSFGGALVADGWLGRYKSLTLFARCVYSCCAEYTADFS